MDYDDERKRLMDEFQEGRKAETLKDLGNTVVVAIIAGAFAWWAYGTLAHACLFAFLCYAISAVGNAVVHEIRRTRLKMETRELLWRRDERLDDDIEAGRVRRSADLV